MLELLAEKGLPAAAPQADKVKAAAEPVFRLAVVKDVEALAGHVQAWERLAKNALEPNPFQEPWMLVPALRAFGRGQRFSLVLVYRHQQAKEAPALIGFFPFQQTRFKKLPVRLLRLWQHVHCFLGTPLLDKDHARDALTTLLDWARNDRDGAPLIEWNRVTGDGPFHRLLIDLIHERNLLTFTEECYTRAFWQADKDAESYLRSALSSNGRQDFRRKRKRLGEQGRLVFRFLEAGEDLETWTRHFLELEAGGWKGQMKTALAHQPLESDYFLEISRAAFQRGQLQMLGLFLDDRPIALKCNFLAGDGAFVFKPAYDEAYSRFSPGALLELDNMHLCHQDPPVRWMDSCTDPDHPMWNRLWIGRRPIHTLLMSTGKRWGDFLVSVRPMLRWLGRLRGQGDKVTR